MGAAQSIPVVRNKISVLRFYIDNMFPCFPNSRSAGCEIHGTGHDLPSDRITMKSFGHHDQLRLVEILALSIFQYMGHQALSSVYLTGYILENKLAQAYVYYRAFPLWHIAHLSYVSLKLKPLFSYFELFLQCFRDGYIISY